VWYEKEKRCYKNKEYVARHALSEKRPGLSAPHPFDPLEFGTINPTRIEFQPFLQGVRGQFGKFPPIDRVEVLPKVIEPIK
jgi:hypothetical protein